MEWRACERFGIIPPDVKPEWDENTAWQHALMMSYNSIREQEEFERDDRIVKALLSPYMKS